MKDKETESEGPQDSNILNLDDEEVDMTIATRHAGENA